MAEFVQAATAPSMWLSDTVVTAVPSITDVTGANKNFRFLYIDTTV